MIVLNHKQIDSIAMRETVRDVFGANCDKGLEALVDTLYVDFMAGRAASYFVATTKNTLTIHSKLPRKRGIMSLHQVTLTEDKELIIVALTTANKKTEETA